MESLERPHGKSINPAVQRAIDTGDHEELSRLAKFGAKIRGDIKETEETLKEERTKKSLQEIKEQANEHIVPIDSDDQN